MMLIGPQSHLDHNLTLAHLRFILERFAARSEFFTATVALPDGLPKLPCSLRGPAVGLGPVPDRDVFMQPRPGRAYPSRILRASAMPDWLWNLQSGHITVIAGPDGDLPCVLYTAFGGPLAPREPGDPTLLESPESERAASEAFWREHALVPNP